MAAEDFLRRWSRLKREGARPEQLEGTRPEQPELAAPPGTPACPQAQPPELPPLESLDFESDFKAFMHAKVEESVKRAALKKLFSDPRFNVMDGLDTYIDDYTKEDPISEEMLARLEHARQTLFGPQPQQEEERKDEVQTAAAPAEAPEENGTRGQDA
jgi:hypothetical protein